MERALCATRSYLLSTVRQARKISSRTSLKAHTRLPDSVRILIYYNALLLLYNTRRTRNAERPDVVLKEQISFMCHKRTATWTKCHSGNRDYYYCYFRKSVETDATTLAIDLFPFAVHVWCTGSFEKNTFESQSRSGILSTVHCSIVACENDIWIHVFTPSATVIRRITLFWCLLNSSKLYSS